MSSGSIFDGNVIPSPTTDWSSRATCAISIVELLGAVVVQRSRKRGNAGEPTLGRRATRIARTPHWSCALMTGATSAQVAAGTPVATAGPATAAVGVGVGGSVGETEGASTTATGGTGVSGAGPDAHGLTIAIASPATMATTHDQDRVETTPARPRR